jgi:hypothetical protein
MLQTYVVNVSSVSDVCCKCFMSRSGNEAQAKVVPSGATVPASRGKQSGRGRRRGARSCIHGRGSMRGARSCIHKRAADAKLHAWVGSRRGAQSCIHGVWQQTWSTKLHPWAGSRRKVRGEAEHEATYIFIENGWSAGAASRRPGASFSVKEDKLVVIFFREKTVVVNLLWLYAAINLFWGKK